IVPVAQLPDAVAQKRGDFHNTLTEFLDPPALHLRSTSLENRETALPIVPAVEQYKKLAVVGQKSHLGISRTLGQPHPQCIRGSAKTLNRKAGAVSDRGVAAIGTYDQVCSDFNWSGWCLPSNAHDPAVLFDELRDLGLHSQVECGVAAALL